MCDKSLKLSFKTLCVIYKNIRVLIISVCFPTGKNKSGQKQSNNDQYDRDLYRTALFDLGLVCVFHHQMPTLLFFYYLFKITAYSNT